MSAVSFVLRVVALVVFFAAAVIIFRWFGVTSGPDPHGLGYLGLGAWVLAELCDGPRPRYFKR